MFLATSTVISAVAVFVVVILALVTILLQAKARLSPSGPVKLNINGDDVEVESGTTLLSTLSNQKIFLPSACGGGGTCASGGADHCVTGKDRGLPPKSIVQTAM